MNELQRIDSNVKGELPGGKKTILRVFDLANPSETLRICKDAAKAILRNIHLPDDSPEWNKLLPAPYISFLQHLEEEDYSNDDLLSDLRLIIHKMQTLKKWEWYSSKGLADGFEIIFSGEFVPQFLWFVHYQNIPYSKMLIAEDDYGEYSIKVYKDVTSYKNFD